MIMKLELSNIRNSNIKNVTLKDGLGFVELPTYYFVNKYPPSNCRCGNFKKQYFTSCYLIHDKLKKKYV